MTIRCPAVGEHFCVQPFCLSWISARFTKDKMHICTFLVRCSSFCRLLHGTALPHFHFQTQVHIASDHTCFLPFPLAAEHLPGTRNHKPYLIRILPTQRSTILTKILPTRNPSARARYKIDVDVSQNRDLSGPTGISIFYFLMVTHVLKITKGNSESPCL
jgi:hypothetical protein